MVVGMDGEMKGGKEKVGLMNRVGWGYVVLKKRRKGIRCMRREVVKVWKVCVC